MKKTYEKPRIYIERLELAEHVASGCGLIVRYGGNTTCKFTDLDGDVSVLFEGTSCTLEGICYYPSSGDVAVWTS